MIEQLRQIAIFAKTVDHGSFRGAARELRLSPSVVSHHISQLEEHLGVALIYRSTRKLALTPEGEKLLIAAHQMLEAINKGLANISMSTTQPTGKLRITVPSILARSRLTTSIADFSKLYPGIELYLTFTDTRQELITDGLDVAIRMGVNRRPPASAKRLFQVKRHVIASSEYLTTRGEVTTPEDIANWDWLELIPVGYIKPTFKKAAHKPITIKVSSQISANDATALYEFVLSGAGVAILPEILAKDDLASGRVAIILPDWELDMIDVFAEWPTNAPRNGLIRLLIDKLIQDLT